jgi:hypothetical protein
MNVLRDDVPHDQMHHSHSGKDGCKRYRTIEQPIDAELFKPKIFSNKQHQQQTDRQQRASYK